MTEVMQGNIIFISIASLSAIEWNLITKKSFSALSWATLTTLIIFHLIRYLIFGYVDPFYKFAIFSTGLGALLIASVVGALFLGARRNRG